MMIFELLLIFSLCCAWYMTGVIWMVQLNTYPQFVHFDSKDFKGYHTYHVKSMNLVVLPMLVEFLAGVGLVIYYPSALVYLLLALLILIWSITFFISVPQHRILEKTFNEVSYNRLISTNWIRTIGWSVRSIICVILLLQAL